MATTKGSAIVLHNDESVAAAGADETSSAGDLQDGYGATAYVEIVPSGTLTVGGQCQLRLSPDDSTYYDYGGPMVSGLVSAAVYTWSIPIPVSAKYIKAVIGSNTGDAAVFRVEVTETTAV